jgi:hypothetical protein
VHASTRILIVLTAAAALVVGWWLLATNNTLMPSAVYGAIWAAVVLVVAYASLKIGFGYNRRVARRSSAAAGPAARVGLTDLDDLRKRDLISPDEYEDKRRQLIDRL